jgi:hypothetical protein
MGNRSKDGRGRTGHGRGEARRLPILRTFGRGGQPWNRDDSIALFSLIVGVLALVVASFTFIPTYLGYRETRRANEIALSPTSTVEPQARITLAALAVKRIAAIDAEIRHSDDPNFKDHGKLSGTLIDVTLKNTGDAPSLITGADFQFIRVAQLSGCPTGGGPLNILGLYDVKVPDKKAPFMIRKEMKYEVRPHSYERFAFRVGPRHITEGEWPFLYDIDITLRLDNNDSLRIGKVQMTQPALESVQPRPPSTAEQDACQTKNAEMLRSFAESSGGTPSADLLSLNKKWRVFRQDSEPAKEVCTQDAVSDNKPKALLDIIEFCATYKRSQLMIRLKAPSHVNELQNTVDVTIQLSSGERYNLSSAFYAYGPSICIGKEGDSAVECPEPNADYSAEWRKTEVVIKALPSGFSAQKDLWLTAKLYNSKVELPDIADTAPDNGQSLHVTRGR